MSTLISEQDPKKSSSFASSVMDGLFEQFVQPKYTIPIQNNFVNPLISYLVAKMTPTIVILSSLLLTIIIIQILTLIKVQ